MQYNYFDARHAPGNRSLPPCCSENYTLYYILRILVYCTPVQTIPLSDLACYTRLQCVKTFDREKDARGKGSNIIRCLTSWILLFVTCVALSGGLKSRGSCRRSMRSRALVGEAVKPGPRLQTISPWKLLQTCSPTTIGPDMTYRYHYLRNTFSRSSQSTSPWIVLFFSP